VNPAHKVSVRPVTLGAVDGERVAVTKGLSAGEMVVTEGGDRLREGADVLLPSAAAAPAAGARPSGAPAGDAAPGTPGSRGSHRPRTHTKPAT
jgi:multidrug efflux system membrane fusion protein